MFNESLFNRDQQENVVTMPTTTSTSIFNQLPVPLMLRMAAWQQVARSDGQLISSVVAAPTSANRTSGQSDRRASGARLGRRQVTNAPATGDPSRPTADINSNGEQQQLSSDILVRLVGHWHAKCALQYLLCYLLSSSLVVLICLRLFGMCTWRRRSHSRLDPHHSSCSTSCPSSATENPASHGFYYQTRLGELHNLC